jgi:hypothetical protein
MSSKSQRWYLLFRKQFSVLHFSMAFELQDLPTWHAFRFLNIEVRACGLSHASHEFLEQQRMKGFS